MSVVQGVPVAIPPPEGYHVDFDNPARQFDTATYWVVGVGNFFALVFLVQRVYVKTAVHRKLGWEDGGLVIAWMFSVAIQAIITRGFVEGFIGAHSWEIPLEKFELFTLYSVYLNSIIYAPPTALAKLVLLIFYLQLGNQSKIFQWSVYAVIAINVGSNLGIFFSSIFACNPIAMGWDITITDGTCINRTAMYKATAIMGVITDVLIIALPIPMVLNLHISRNKKIGLLAMFAIGSATVVTSIVRLALLIQSLSLAGDPTWGAGPVSLWICIEANLLIMCASLPTIRLFFRTVAPGLVSSEHSKGYSYGNKNSQSGSHHLRSNPRMHNFRGLEDKDYRMSTFVSTGGKVTPTTKSAEDMEWNADDNSEHGIMQTKSTHVTYTQSRGS